jgi:hypothetical protein
MGVEPTRDRAERPPSRFEDGEAHRSLYTSMIYSNDIIFAPHVLSCQAIHHIVQAIDKEKNLR